MVVDVVDRRDGGIAPADILDQFAAAALEGAKIRISRIQDRSRANVGRVSVFSRRIGGRGPPRVRKHDELEVIVSEQFLQAVGWVAGIRQPCRPIRHVAGLIAADAVTREDARRS